MKFLPLFFGLLLVSPAAAQNAEPFSALTIKGECQALTAGDEDLLDICAGEVAQVIYMDARMELAIWTTDPSDRFIVLAGPTEDGPDGWAFQTIDEVIVAPDGSGNNNVTHKATGLCTFGDFFVGNAQYRCEAVTKDGSVYNFAFLSEDGVPESMLD